jgi:glycosyltransferase involved in cell wall biosynthesis
MSDFPSPIQTAQPAPSADAVSERGVTAVPVAVIVPAFNASGTIGAALASIASQTVRPTIVVVADDHSSDTTVRVAEPWADQIPLRVVRLQQNLGPAAARRAALDACDSPLVALLDADDAWLPDHLGNLLTTRDRAGGGVVCADAFLWRPGRGVAKTTYRDRHPIPQPGDQLENILRENFVSIGALFSRHDYDEVGGFRDGFTAAEDWDLWIRLVRAGQVVTGAPGPTLLYRVAEGGLTQSGNAVQSYSRVLSAALIESRDDRERKAAGAGLRWVASRLRLATAYQAARAGQRGAARSAAFGCLRGPTRLALEASMILAAPRLGARLGDFARRARL